MAEVEARGPVRSANWSTVAGQLWMRPDCGARSGGIDPACANDRGRALVLLEVFAPPEFIAGKLELAVAIPVVGIELECRAATAPVVHDVLVLLPDQEPNAR